MWKRIHDLAKQLTARERAQTNVEYALILILVALTTVVLLAALSNQTNGVLMGSVANSLANP